MALWGWARSLSRKQVGGLVLLAALIVVSTQVRGFGEEELPTAAESRRIGWQAASASADLARDVYERVNDERTQRGLPPLAWDEELTALAQGWSEQMIESGVYEHSPETYRTRPRFGGGHAENIALGQRTSMELHVGWMRSEGHRRNILSPDLDAIGIGVVCRNDGIAWATQIFGRSEPGPPLPAVDTSEEPIVRGDRGIDCPRTRAGPSLGLS